MKTFLERYTPQQIAKPDKKNPDGKGLLPFKYFTILVMISRGELAAINVGSQLKPKYLVDSNVIQEWWRKKEKNSND